LDLLMRRQQQSGGLDAIIVELSGIAEPKEVLQNWSMARDFGHPAALACKLQSVLTVLDVAAARQVWMGATPTESGEGRLPLAALMAEQIEAASMVLLSKMDLAKEEDLRAAEELVVALNPSAKVVQAREGVVEQPEALWETTFEEGDVVVAADASNAYSRKSAADKYGIKTFTYTARRPFITAAFMQLLHEMQEDCSKDDYIQRAGLLRMKGVCWLTSEPAKEHRLNYAGRNYRTMAVAPWFAVCDETYLDMRLAHPIDREAYQRVKSYAWDDGGWGDRRQELVCIGGRGSCM